MSETAGCIPIFIAQIEAPKGDVSELHGLLLVIVAMAFVMGIIGYFLIRKYRNVETPEDEAPFTLSQLRRIFEAGEISLEEFEHMRESMIAKVKASLGTDEIKVDESPGQEPHEPDEANGGEGEDPDEKDVKDESDEKDESDSDAHDEGENDKHVP